MKYIILSKLKQEKAKSIRQRDFIMARRFDMAIQRLKKLP